MTQPQEPEYIAPTPPPPAQATTRLTPPRRSCTSRFMSFIGWVLTILLSTTLALAAAGAIFYYYFGFNFSTPSEIRQANLDVATLQSKNLALQTEIALLRTADAGQASNISLARERIDDMEPKVADYEQKATEIADQIATTVALAQDLNETIDLAATIQSEARQGQMLAAVVATVQTNNSIQLSDLQRRTERISRFLQRLGDLASDLDSEE
ncbi:MAG: hypothetical protein HGA19_22700, partial [Oscillochloris sp.]|nr:hypothetical protein [Oscillochloris sp.]